MRKIDVFIPTFNRAIMLELLLYSIHLNLKCYNHIYVFYEVSDDYFLQGYDKCKIKYEKIFNDKISFIKKKSLGHTSELFNKYIKNDLLILTDDCMLINEFNLIESPSSKVFFKDKKILSNSLRYSIDMNDQSPSNERSTGLFKNDKTNVNNQIFNFAKPQFINFNYTDHVNEDHNNITPDYGIWNIFDSLNSTSASSFLNPSLQIFRKEDFLRWIKNFSSEKSFLNITSALNKEYYLKIFGNKFLYFLLNVLDKAYHSICKMKNNQNIRASHIFKNFFSSYLSKRKNISLPYLMCCPKNQVGFDYNIGSFHQIKNIEIFKYLNEQYLFDYRINYKKFKLVKMKYNFPYITIDTKYFIKHLLTKNDKK